MSSRRPRWLLKTRLATVVVVWMALWLEITPGAESAATIAIAEGSLLDQEPCSIPPALYFRGSRFGSRSVNANIDAGASDDLLGIDCDDSGASNSGDDQLLEIDRNDGGSSSRASDDPLLDIDCDDDEDDGASGQMLDVKDDHQAPSSADQSTSNGHDGLNQNQLFSEIRYDSIDSSASGDALNLGAMSGPSATKIHSDTSQPSVTSASNPANAIPSGTLRVTSVGAAPPLSATVTAAPSTRVAHAHSQDAHGSSVDCEQPLPAPAIYPGKPNHSNLVDSDLAQDGSDDCEQPLPQATTSISSSADILDARDGSDDCEQPLPVPATPAQPASADHVDAYDSSNDCDQPLSVPTTPTHLSLSGLLSAHGGSDDCEQPLPQPPTPVQSTLADHVDASDGSDDCEQPLPVPALRHTPSTSPPCVAATTAPPTSAALGTTLPTAPEPTIYPPTSPNLFLRVSLMPFCVGDATPVSVEGVEGMFCVPGFYICSSHRDDGACPGAQPGLPDGSHCGIVRTGVYGCRPGPQPPSTAAASCRINGTVPVSVVGTGTFCAERPVCAGTVFGNCPLAQPGLSVDSRCQSISTGVFGCTA